MTNSEEINESTLLAYLNKELSNDEMIKVDRWLIQSSANMDKLNDIREVWKMSGRLKSKPVEVDADAAWNKVLGQIDTSSTQTIPLPHKSSQKRMMIAAFAAGIALLVGISTLFLFNGNEGSSGQLQLVSGDGVVTEQLPDGSDVTLNENSVLSYPPEFNEDERRVALTGEAFFDIERNEEKPFVIDLPNKFYVKVLGTAFTIKANESETHTEVLVSEGKVEFGSETDKVILLAGEKAIMDNETGIVQKIQDENAKHIDTFWMNKQLEFEGESMEQVVSILNEVYSDRVFLECERLKDEPVRSMHYDDSIDEVLEALRVSHGFEIEKISSESGTEYYLKCDG